MAEDEAGVASSETVMNVPHDLVSQVRALIARHHELTHLRCRGDTVRGLC